MTSLVSWIGVDSRAHSSIYIASDSRITWDENDSHWDYARKVFASQRYPDIIGYAGDVIFPSQVLGQILYLIDADLLFDRENTPQEKASIIFDVVKSSFRNYPAQYRRGFSIVYCTRENDKMESIFHVFQFIWKTNVGWKQEEMVVPSHSGIVCLLGSGGKHIKKWHERWNHIDSAKDTSRSVFCAFCDSIISGDDKRSGGSPQLVGIYRIGSGKDFGIVFGRKRYFLGLPAKDTQGLSNIEWRNSLFEVCDWKALCKIANAQKHEHPKGLGRSL